MLLQVVVTGAMGSSSSTGAGTVAATARVVAGATARAAAGPRAAVAATAVAGAASGTPTRGGAMRAKEGGWGSAERAEAGAGGEGGIGTGAGVEGRGGEGVLTRITETVSALREAAPMRARVGGGAGAGGEGATTAPLRSHSSSSGPSRGGGEGGAGEEGGEGQRGAAVVRSLLRPVARAGVRVWGGGSRQVLRGSQVWRLGRGGNQGGLQLMSSLAGGGGCSRFVALQAGGPVLQDGPA